LLVLLELRAFKVLRVCRAHKAYKVQRAFKVSVAQQEFLVLLAFKVPKDQLDSKAHREYRVRLVLKVR
jgi:hypothetical protein